MPYINAPQQSDAWLRARCGRITGSKLKDVCAYLTRKSGDRKAGEPKSERITYMRQLIGERLSGRVANHFPTPYMQHGEMEEGPARMFYEEITRQLVLPVTFVVHDTLPFTGATADGLIGKEGLLEIKNPETANHIEYLERKQLPNDYVPQCAHELSCSGKQRRWVDFLSFDRRIVDRQACYFLHRTGRDELEWKVGDRLLSGESVIDYFTEEVCKLNAEIDYWLAERGFKAIAPFPVELVEAEQEPEDDYDHSKSFADNCGFLDSGAELLDAI